MFKTAENDADATDSSKKGASTSWVKNAFVKFKNFTSNQIKDFASAVKSLFNSSEFDDNVLRALRDKTLSTLGVRWSFSNPNSWYICLGVLFGGLIIQGGNGEFGQNQLYCDVQFPISFTALVVIPLDSYYTTATTAPIKPLGWNTQATTNSKFRVLAEDYKFIQGFHWFAVGKS